MDQKSGHFILEINLTDEKSNDGKIDKCKILEQTNCARCFTPLIKPSVDDGELGHWEGCVKKSREPMNPRDKFLRVSGCGHVFHSMCITSVDRCGRCSRKIEAKDTRPLFYNKEVTRKAGPRVVFNGEPNYVDMELLNEGKVTGLSDFVHRSRRICKGIGSRTNLIWSLV